MYRDPSSTNSFVPSWEATGQVVTYVRDPKNFQLNDYICFKPATKPVGLFLALAGEDALRVVSDEEFAWADGAARPEGNHNLMGMEYREYRCERRDIPFTLGDRLVAAAPWDVVGAHAMAAMSQYMTLLSWRCVSFLENTGNWGTHTATAATLSGNAGGHWDDSTTTLGTIQKSLHAAVEAIIQDTNSTVKAEQLRIVIGVQAARKLRTSLEIMDYIKNTPVALAQVRGDLPGRNVLFGLPDHLFGYELVVEKAQRVTTRKNAAGTYTRTWVKDPDSALIMSKIDALPGEFASDSAGVPNFSTFQVFYYVGEKKEGTAPEAAEFVKSDGQETGGQPFVVETFQDSKNRRTEGHVVSDFGLKMVSAESGYLIQDILA